MNKKYTLLLLLLIIFLVPVVYSSGWHIAGEVLSGNFTGNYNFTSDVDFKSNIYISSKTSCGKLYTDSSGNVLCGSDSNSGGDITSVTAGNQLTGGGTSGDVTIDLSEGSGSGLDADMVDGQHASSFATSSHTHNYLISRTNYDITDSSVPTTVDNTGDLKLDFIDDFSGGGSGYRSILSVTGYGDYRGMNQLAFPYNSGSDAELYIRNSNYQDDAWGSWYKIWHSGVDGSGSGLDADMLDGISSGNFLRSDTSDTMNGNLNMNGNNIQSTDYVSFENHEHADFDSDGLLYWDLSAGLYIKSSNSAGAQTGGSLLWSSENFHTGSEISVSYDSEDEPTLSVVDNWVDESGDTMSGTILWDSSYETPLTFDNGAAQITVHDGYGNFNILSGINHNNQIVSGSGGARIEFNDGGSVDIEIYSGSEGTTGSETASFEIDGGGASLSGGDLNMNGNNIDNAGAYYYSSDRRLKKNISRIDDNLDKIMKIDGVRFQWRDDNKTALGFIAQDVEKFYPELVNTNNDTGLKSINYDGMIAPMLETIKEQQKSIEKQNKKIDFLTKQLNEIKNDKKN